MAASRNADIRSKTNQQRHNKPLRDSTTRQKLKATLCDSRGTEPGGSTPHGSARQRPEQASSPNKSAFDPSLHVQAPLLASHRLHDGAGPKAPLLPASLPSAVISKTKTCCHLLLQIAQNMDTSQLQVDSPLTGSCLAVRQ